MPTSNGGALLSGRPNGRHRVDARAQRGELTISSPPLLLAIRLLLKRASKPRSRPHHFKCCAQTLVRSCCRPQIQRVTQARLYARRHQRSSRAISILPQLQVKTSRLEPLLPCTLSPTLTQLFIRPSVDQTADSSVSIALSRDDSYLPCIPLCRYPVLALPVLYAIQFSGF